MYSKRNLKKSTVVWFHIYSNSILIKRPEQNFATVGNRAFSTVPAYNFIWYITSNNVERIKDERLTDVLAFIEHIKDLIMKGNILSYHNRHKCLKYIYETCKIFSI